MRRAVCSTLSFCLASLISAIATAQEAPATGAHTHDGFYARIALGAGFGFGKNEIDVAGSPSADVSGVAGAGELALGGTVARGLVIGGGSYNAFLTVPKYKSAAGDIKGGPLVFNSLGPFADFYFDPHGGAHAQAAILLASAQQLSGKDLDEDSGGGGFSFMLGGGYEWWVGAEWSVGVLARFQYFRAKLKGENSQIESTVSMFVPALLIGATYH